MRSLSMKMQLLMAGIGVAVIPLTIVAAFLYFQSNSISNLAKEALIEEGYQQMENEVQGILDTVKITQQLLKDQVSKVLTMAVDRLEQRGGIAFSSSEQVEWTATNQYTGARQRLSLPAVLLGDSTRIERQESFDKVVPLIDTLGELTGDTLTLFQRMNPAGDMLRVATNVEKNGKRAVGTYIPATNPDGKPNPVLAEVLEGRTYVGRAYVVDRWYVTAYKPLLDDAGEVVGILYVGTPEATATQPLLDQLAERQIGETGYVFVLNTKGDEAGNYVLSDDRARDGESVLESRDAEGGYFIQEMIETAQQLDPGETASMQYSWKNPGERTAREKTAVYAYFPDWDWLIAASAYDSEFYAAAEGVEHSINSLTNWVFILTLTMAVIAGLVFYFLARGIAGPLGRIADELHSGSLETEKASEQVSASSQSLAQGANEQAASLEQSTASMENISDLVSQNRALTRQTSESSQQAKDAAKNGVDSMHQLSTAVGQVGSSVGELNQAINEINDSSAAISKIIGTIDAIAFQTNILALNASVEAARAGEAGAGFAVVAEEVRNLATRTTNAAKETESLIKGSVESSEKGVAMNATVVSLLEEVKQRAAQVDDALGHIDGSVDRVYEAMQQMDAGAAEQNEGIDQIKIALQQVSEVTQQTASNAEQAAAASGELNDQANLLRALVDRLNQIITGQSAAAGGAEPIT